MVIIYVMGGKGGVAVVIIYVGWGGGKQTDHINETYFTLPKRQHKTLSDLPALRPRDDFVTQHRQSLNP